MPTIHRQTGAVLLLVLLVVIIGMGAVLLSIYSKSALQVENDQKTARVLAEAKAALLSYAATYASDNPGEYGFLPCPDLSVTAITEGGADGSCGNKNTSTLGRLPWRTLGLPALRGGAGECLWYAVSGAYKANPKTDMLNEDSNGQFQLYDSSGNLIKGSTPQDRVVAVVIAPGKRLSIQNSDRTDLATGTPQGTEICGGNYTAASYLEGNGTIDNATQSGTADTIDSFINASASSKSDNTPFNDQIITITREEIWDAVRTLTAFSDDMDNLTSAAAQCLTDYGNLTPGTPWWCTFWPWASGCNPSASDRRLPWPAQLTFTNIDYRDDSDYDDSLSTTSKLGRLPSTYNVSYWWSYKSTSPNLQTCLSTQDPQLATLWQHWKDHLFYVVSGDYAPDASSTPSCSTNCVSTTGDNYAAIVFFANSPEDAITRNAPPPTTDPDDKQLISNYLEGNNASNYPDASGSGTYQNDAAVDDILYCIKPNGTNLNDPISCP